MSVVRLRLPQNEFERNAAASRTFIIQSDFRGAKNQACTDVEFASRVEKGIGYLNQGITEKIVLSRIFSFPQQGLTAESIFNSFNEKFPNAAVFAFTDEQHVQWVGATPELLFKKRGLSYTTISLAGTRKAGSSEDWGTKEIQEQKLVTDFIQQELELLGAERVFCGDVQTRNAGSIEHLCNEISFEYSGDWKNVLKALHPTPAVCGMPRSEAKDLIEKLEEHDREYYTGLIGIEQGDNVDLYVILRCLKIEDAKLHVFVGAGITKDSIPELEARETRWKAESLTDVIF
jgi:isochorismate synthase